MTSRTDIAALALQGILSNPEYEYGGHAAALAEHAVRAADALITELAKPVAPGVVPLADLENLARAIHYDATRMLETRPLSEAAQSTCMGAVKLLEMVERMKETGK